MAASGDQWIGPLNEVPSLNAVLRALKREESSLFNCIASIVDDAQFVEQARGPAWQAALPLAAARAATARAAVSPLHASQPPFAGDASVPLAARVSQPAVRPVVCEASHPRHLLLQVNRWGCSLIVAPPKGKLLY